MCYCSHHLGVRVGDLQNIPVPHPPQFRRDYCCGTVKTVKVNSTRACNIAVFVEPSAIVCYPNSEAPVEFML